MHQSLLMFLKWKSSYKDNSDLSGNKFHKLLLKILQNCVLHLKKVTFIFSSNDLIYFSKAHVIIMLHWEVIYCSVNFLSLKQYILYTLFIVYNKILIIEVIFCPAS